MLNARDTRAIVLAAPLFITTGVATRAQDNNPTVYRDVETKYIFGFTEGSGIGLEGERGIFMGDRRAVRKGGRTLLGERDQARIRVHAKPIRATRIRTAAFNARHQRTSPTWTTATRSTFGGFFGEIRYLLLDRGPSSPLAVTLSLEAEWRRSDETSGQRVTNFELELKVNADLELIQEPALSRQPICSTNRRRHTIRITSGQVGRRN